MSKDSRDSLWLFAVLLFAALGLGIPWVIETKKDVAACVARVCTVGAPKLVDAECICVITPEGAPR